MNNIPKRRYGFPTWSQIEYNMFSKYVPLQRIVDTVEKYVQEYQICKLASMVGKVALYVHSHGICLFTSLTFVSSAYTFDRLKRLDATKKENFSHWVSKLCGVNTGKDFYDD